MAGPKRSTDAADDDDDAGDDDDAAEDDDDDWVDWLRLVQDWFRVGPGWIQTGSSSFRLVQTKKLVQTEFELV